MNQIDAKEWERVTFQNDEVYTQTKPDDILYKSDGYESYFLCTPSTVAYNNALYPNIIVYSKGNPDILSECRAFLHILKTRHRIKTVAIQCKKGRWNPYWRKYSDSVYTEPEYITVDGIEREIRLLCI